MDVDGDWSELNGVVADGSKLRAGSTISVLHDEGLRMMVARKGRERERKSGRERREERWLEDSRQRRPGRGLREGGGGKVGG